MVGKRSLWCVLFLGISLSNFAASRTITKLKIIDSGLTLDSSTAEGCKKFKPTANQVKRFFSRAYPVEHYMLTTERYSPCYAKGTIKFSDNNQGDWWLYSGGTAVIEWNRGKSVDLLYKYNRWHDPFAGAYGLCSEGEC